MKHRAEGRFAAAGLYLMVLVCAPASAADAEPDYPHGEYRADCAICHRTEGWVPAVVSERFDHAATGFPLSGAHGRTLCRACHMTLEFRAVSSACVSCHQDVHQGELGTDCALCHSTRNFIDRADEVRSHRLTRFPLSGAHAIADCEDCHPLQPQGGLIYVNTPVDCDACHIEQFNAATDPDHVAAGFDRDCVRCHTVTMWQQVRFDHAAVGFALVGVHRNLDCAECHVGGAFAGTSTQCSSCHRQDFELAADPDHVAGGFPLDCQDCHTSQAWSPASFDHAKSGFPLTGAHTAQDCRACHVAGLAAPLDSQCFACHQTDFQTAPGHVDGGYPRACEDCHGTGSWEGAVIDHGFFPLSGGHAGLDCLQCHGAGIGAPVASDCHSCHAHDYQAAPGHVDGGYPLACEDCHGINSWSGATINHDFFPLSGGHAGIDCQQCHSAGIGAPLASDCYSCHADDYQGAPGHVSSGYSRSCENCHGITTWSGATINHDFFPLSGGHAGVECTTCHTNGSFTSIPSDCYSCHRSDYQQAPDHASVGFSTACESCHNINSWEQARLVHTFLLRGEHDEPCMNCHTGGSPANFSCLGACHEHTRSEMDSKHRGRGGYVYDFPTCLNCHPDGRE